MRVTVLFLFVMLFSCKKDNGVEPVLKSPVQLLTIRDWKLVSHGFDDNKNNKVDDEENLINDCQRKNRYSFHQDGTGSLIDYTQSCTNPVNNLFDWQFQTNHSRLIITTQEFFIHSLNEDELVLSPELPGLTTKYLLIYRH